MTKISELNIILGAVLSLGVLASYGFLYSQLSYLNALGAMMFFTISLALLPVLLIGLSTAMSRSKFQKFSTNGFKTGAFLLITLLMYVVWVGPSYWPFTLIFGALTGGLLFAIIKLDEYISKLIFTLFGLVFAGFIVFASFTFVN